MTNSSLYFRLCLLPEVPSEPTAAAVLVARHGSGLPRASTRYSRRQDELFNRITGSSEQRYEQLYGTAERADPNNEPDGSIRPTSLYFGLARKDGFIDKTYPYLIDAVSELSSDCIFFSWLICELLSAEGHKMRDDKKWLPSVVPVGFQEPVAAGLIPNPRDYTGWHNLAPRWKELATPLYDKYLVLSAAIDALRSQVGLGKIGWTGNSDTGNPVRSRRHSGGQRLSSAFSAWREALETEGIDVSVWRIHRKIGMSGGLFTNMLLA